MSTIAIRSPLPAQYLLRVRSGGRFPAAGDANERQSSTALVSAEAFLDRLAGDLRDGNTTAPGFAAQGGCQRFGEADCGALHTCIIAYHSELTLAARVAIVATNRSQVRRLAEMRTLQVTVTAGEPLSSAPLS